MLKNKKLIKVSNFLSTGNMDQIGRVFIHNNRIFRGINKDSVDRIKKLLNSGLIKELEKNNLFPKTTVTNYYSKDFPLILEHQRIKVAPYSQEWSFEMMKDAAVATLKINIIANKYGYQTIDAHQGNIVFDFTQPKFVDLGSFIKIETSGAWFASEEFLRSYYYPLILWSKGYESFAFSEIPHDTYVRIRYVVSRIIPLSLYKKVFNNYFTLMRISAVPEELIKNRVHPLLFRIFRFAKKNNLLPFQAFNLEKYIKKISRLKNHSISYWRNYYESGSYVPDRFFKIVELIRDKKIKEVVDLASNNGTFTKLLFKKKLINKAVCIDYDKGSIDQLYTSAKQNGYNIVPVAQNIFSPILSKTNESLDIRFKSDAVFALAITHHLLLAQYLRIDCILSKIISFSKKYVFIEFMPLGLWNGHYAPPVPKWYNQKWFEKKLSEYCKIENIIRLEKNRILFVGKVIKSNSNGINKERIKKHSHS